MKLVGRLLINTLALLIVDYLLPGVEITGLWTAIVTAVVLGVVNTLIKPILQVIALPISIMTFGIAAFLINVLLLWSVNLVVQGFNITNFQTAIIASILLAVISWFLHDLAED